MTQSGTERTAESGAERMSNGSGLPTDANKQARQTFPHKRLQRTQQMGDAENALCCEARCSVLRGQAQHAAMADAPHCANSPTVQPVPALPFSQKKSSTVGFPCKHTGTNWPIGLETETDNTVSVFLYACSGRATCYPTGCSSTHAAG